MLNDKSGNPATLIPASSNPIPQKLRNIATSKADLLEISNRYPPQDSPQVKKGEAVADNGLSGGRPIPHVLFTHNIVNRRKFFHVSIY